MDTCHSRTVLSIEADSKNCVDREKDRFGLLVALSAAQQGCNAVPSSQ